MTVNYMFKGIPVAFMGHHWYDPDDWEYSYLEINRILLKELTTKDVIKNELKR